MSASVSVAVKAVAEVIAEAVETDVVVVDAVVHTTVADATVAVIVGMEGNGEAMANAAMTTTRTRVDPTHN